MMNPRRYWLALGLYGLAVAWSIGVMGDKWLFGVYVAIGVWLARGLVERERR